MPEEKKESFTFSDKIKSSKPAGNKSFAKSSSKIGRDGKPKQTLFERTRRDAPFFIAALVALLLLPFLYKYSGQSGEDTLLTPGSEATEFDSERYGFDTTLIEDPDGQLAQLSGRSSFDYIKGWGTAEEEEGSERDDLDFDASASASASGEFDAEGRYDAEHHSRTDIDEEENITNIYKRRARAGTRAAFKRTPIGKLDTASLRNPRGGLKLQPWGGKMKDAASKVKDGPRNAPKPVSLQPLRAGGPARSTFGQGAAGAARKGLDNMGKANAIEALRDSYVKPVDPTRTGGIDLFSDGRTGGSGKLDHHINIGKGQTPWWWDMMKTRMQREWEERFKYKWGWINWATDIAKNILKGLINCLITGDSDGDPDHFLGDVSIGGGSSGKKECCGMNEAKWNASGDLGKKGLSFDELSCKSNKGAVASAAGKTVEECGKIGWWKDKSSSAGASVGFFGKRLCCLGICKAGAYVSGDLSLNAVGGGRICDDMPGLYRVYPSGKARNWHVYTYVLARNYFPEEFKSQIHSQFVPQGGNLLCAQADRDHKGNKLNHTGRQSAGAGLMSTSGSKQGKDHQASVNTAKNASTRTTGDKQEIRSRISEVDRNSHANACVIYLQSSGVFSYETFKNHMIDTFMKLGLTEESATQAFFKLDLLSVQAVAMKDNLAAGRGDSVHQLYDGMLPMLFWEFEDAYIEHKGVTNRSNGHDNNISKKKYRIEGQDMIRADECFFEDWQFECLSETQASAQLRAHSQTYKDGKWVLDPSKKLNPSQFRVTAKFLDANAEEELEEETKEGEKGAEPSPKAKAAAATSSVVNATPVVSTDGYSITYTLPGIDQLIKDAKGEDLVGSIIWTVTGPNGHVTAHSCPFGASGVQPQDTPGIDMQCHPGVTEEIAEGYPGLPGCPAKHTCLPDGTWGNPQMTSPDDPRCQRREGNLIVDFYQRFQDLPCEDSIYDAQRRINAARHGATEAVDPCPDWQGCELESWKAKLIAPDNITIKYVQEAISAYNKRGGDSTFKEYTPETLKNDLTAGNLVDAIRMHPSADVPANVACVLGKTIGGYAADPQAGELFDNVFGAFLAFIGIDMASFPGKWTFQCEDGTNSITNKRFLCSGNYWWGGYVDSNQEGAKGLGKRDHFEDVKYGNVWEGYPLSGLARAKDKFPTTEDGVTLQRPANLKKGQSVEEYYRDLLLETYHDLGFGEECQYPESTKLSKADVLAYIETLCKTGDQVKPMAWLKCNQVKDKKAAKPRTSHKRKSKVKTTKRKYNRSQPTNTRKTRWCRKVGDC